jgi:hypothetical protein
MPRRSASHRRRVAVLQTLRRDGKRTSGRRVLRKRPRKQRQSNAFPTRPTRADVPPKRLDSSPGATVIRSRRTTRRKGVTRTAQEHGRAGRFTERAPGPVDRARSPVRSTDPTGSTVKRRSRPRRSLATDAALCSRIRCAIVRGNSHRLSTATSETAGAAIQQLTETRSQARRTTVSGHSTGVTTANASVLVAPSIRCRIRSLVSNKPLQLGRRSIVMSNQTREVRVDITLKRYMVIFQLLFR